jgi:pimeloyl-ACP methyl ester carboxylesterase
MTRLLLWLALLAIALAAPARAQQPIAGDWNGVLTTPGGPLRLILTIRQGADGALSAELESPDQAPGQKIPVPTIAMADGRLSFAIPLIGARYEGQWQAGRQVFAGNFRQAADLPLELARGAGAATPVIEGLDGAWHGSVERNGATLRLVLRVMSGPRGTSAMLDSPDMLAYGLPVTGLNRDGRRVRFAVPAGGTAFDGMLAENGQAMTGRWTRAGSPDVTVTLSRQQQPSAARARPQLPRPPLPYRSEEVSFANPHAADVTLAGTLTLPEGRGPFPAAILISGSGPQDRDETLLGHKPFAVLADHLTRAGIAVLRYDDRGVGRSTGSHGSATSADFATDANAAFAFLAGRPEIDRRKIGFIGHSEGGLIGPVAALDNADLAYLVLLAGPGTASPRLMESQRRAIGRSQGMTDAELDRTAPLQQRIFAIAASDRNDADARAAALAAVAEAGVPAAQRETMVANVASPWFRWFLRYDPAPVLARIRVPVLAINGALDQQVLSAENLAGIRAALAGNPDVTVTELPGLNHLFQTARTGGVGEYADIEETMAPVAMETVSRWIKARF